MTKIILGALAAITFSCISSETTIPSIHVFKVKTLEGEVFDFASLKGKKIMIVNTASKCGLTPQYEQLEGLYKKYKDQNFIISEKPFFSLVIQELVVRKQIWSPQTP